MAVRIDQHENSRQNIPYSTRERRIKNVTTQRFVSAKAGRQE